ncbi:hypothetical protein ACH5RR_015340 [Cinchona calisaya]|uniref:Uncharacterized protein n=1 Tax=Cinchona calisaya TaxID=153742 RepID=A0ABD2ZUQ1_9GENT
MKKPQKSLQDQLISNLDSEYTSATDHGNESLLPYAKIDKGFPLQMKFVLGVSFRTNNEPFKVKFNSSYLTFFS